MADKIDTSEIESRERFARDEMQRRIKKHYDQQGKQVTGTAIEKEVAEMQHRIHRQRDHNLYKDKK